MEEIAGYDTAAGWTLANPLDWAYLCARLPDAGAEDIYSRGANVVIAAQFGRPMQAAPAQGGYRITGRAPFVSNCYDAHWVATTATVMAGDPSRASVTSRSCGIMPLAPSPGMRRSGRCIWVCPRTSRCSRSKRLVRAQGVGGDVANALWTPRQQGGQARGLSQVVPQ